VNNQIGIWGSGPWRDEAKAGEAVDVAAEIEQLGFTSLWLSAGFGVGIPARFSQLLKATTRITVATGILSIWHASPEDTAHAVADLDNRFPGRFTLGLGASHAPLVEALSVPYERPYSQMVEYLTALAAQVPAVRADQRVLAALGPRMLTLAGERAAGAHPYFVPVAHTEFARTTLGPGPKLYPEQAIVFETDPDRARTIARGHTTSYLRLPNYTNNLRRFGFGDADFLDGGSDRLVDAIVAWGDESAIHSRVEQHLAAGADQVLIQVINETLDQFPTAEYRRLAALLS